MKMRFEEDILSPVVKRFLADRYPFAKCEMPVPLPPSLPGHSVRLDVVAADRNELVLVETKAACYLEKIGDAIGQLLVYEQILLQYREMFLGALKEKGAPIEAIAKPKLYCAFPDREDPDFYREWKPSCTDIFRAICGERKVGLLLIRFREAAAVHEWTQIAESNLGDLNVVEVVAP